MSHSFDAFVLLISIPSERSILFYSKNLNSYKQSSKTLVDNVCCLLEKGTTIVKTIIVNLWSFSILFKEKL